MVELTARARRARAIPVPAALRRVVDARLPLGLAAGGAIGGLGFANGGYFPVSWGWSSLPLLGLAAVVLALGIAVEASRATWLFLGALAAYTGWVALSLLWTSTTTQTVFETERTVVYLAAALAGVLLLRRASAPSLLVSAWAAIAVVCGYALATRLFPDRLGSYDPIALNRLAQPVGYWNALGIVAAMGALVALGLAARGGPVVRCLAAASAPVLLLTLYFTFSRGGWIALFLGLAAAIAIDRRRLQLITVAGVLGLWSALGILAASRAPALTHVGAALAASKRDGHGLAVIAIALAVAAGLTMLGFDWLEDSVTVGESVRRAYAGTLLFLLAAFLIVVFGRYGFPPTLARKAYDAFQTPTGYTGGDLNKRLFNLSGSGRSEQFHTAVQQISAHPLLGGGAGSYADYWFRHRRVPQTVHDAHSLYLETLGELGAPGMALLAVLLAAPLAGLARARSSPFAAAALAAYVAFLVHAAIDWDWEMPAVTLAALCCGLALLALGRRETEPRRLPSAVRWGGLAATVAVGGFAVLGLLGNSAVSASSQAMRAGQYAKAESEARKATRYAPWSSEPWRKLGEAQANAGDYAAARASFRTAIAKDPNDWTLWYELAVASLGKEHRLALAQAARLNPLDPRLKPSG